MNRARYSAVLYLVCCIYGQLAPRKKPHSFGVESEFSRTLRSFCRMADTWKELAKQDAPAGYRSPYVYKQASMYDAFSSQCQALLYVEALTIRERHLDERPVSITRTVRRNPS